RRKLKGAFDLRMASLDSRNAQTGKATQSGSPPFDSPCVVNGVLPEGSTSRDWSARPRESYRKKFCQELSRPRLVKWGGLSETNIPMVFPLVGNFVPRRAPHPELMGS